MPINADLHCHSVVSDGTLSPEELALRAHQNGVHLWSLTDHDVLGGQARAQDAALNLGIEYVPGVEIPISWMGQTVHIIGLGFDPSNVTLQDGLRATRDGREERARQMAIQQTIAQQAAVPRPQPQPQVIYVRRNLTVAEILVLFALACGVVTGIQFGWNAVSNVLPRLEIKVK